MDERGLFVGRFQPVHNGHLSALENILDQVDRLIIVVGSSQYSHTPENPFTAGERVWMLEEALAERGREASIVPVPDIHRNSLWVSHVETFVPPFSVAFTNNPLPARLFREAGYEVRSFDLVERETYEATRVRRLLIEGGAWEPLVPTSVAAIIRETDGIERIRDVSESDAADEPLTERPPYDKNNR